VLLKEIKRFFLKYNVQKHIGKQEVRPNLDYTMSAPNVIDYFATLTVKKSNKSSTEIDSEPYESTLVCAKCENIHNEGQNISAKSLWESAITDIVFLHSNEGKWETRFVSVAYSCYLVPICSEHENG